MTDFNEAAAAWDEDPVKTNLALDIGAAIVREVPLSNEMDVLEFGCGTGLITLQFQPHVRQIMGVDSSPGMLAVLDRKISAAGIANLHTRLLGNGEALAGTYDLLVSSMVMHHVSDIPQLLAQFFHVLKPAGRLALADLDPEDGAFHPEPNGVFHYGFDHDELRCQLEAAGFRHVQFSAAAEVLREHAPGVKRTYSVFLSTAVRPF